MHVGILCHEYIHHIPSFLLKVFCGESFSQQVFFLCLFCFVFFFWGDFFFLKSLGIENVGK